MNDLFIKKIFIEGKKLEIKIGLTGKWKHYIKEPSFFCEYNKSIEGVPESLAIIPLLGNILPIAWVHNLNIFVDKLDQSFYSYLPEVLEGYEKMYPQMCFHNNLKVQYLEDNHRNIIGKEASFFSGGVDAYFTFLRHENTISALATVWGADISLDDETGWHNANTEIEKVAKKYGIENYTIKSNFRDMINTIALNSALNHPGWSWWHEFQHGMGLITLIAPMSYVDGLSKIYIASSYTADIKGLTCASDPSIDNYVRFNNCQVIHDGFESDRQNKVKYLVNYVKDNNDSMDLRVCWLSRGGRNCCICEKCCRTMLAIILEDGLPRDFGFEGKNATLKKIARNMKYRNSGLARDWDILHKKMREKYTLFSVPREWKWFYVNGADSINNNTVYKIIVINRKIKSKISHQVRKVYRIIKEK